jgi:hypothetical protein
MNDVTYTGEYNKINQRHGTGTSHYQTVFDNVEYKGEWTNNQRHGEGTYYTNNETFTGEWVNNQFIKGKCVIAFPAISIKLCFEGDFKAGKPHGYCKLHIIYKSLKYKYVSKPEYIHTKYLLYDGQFEDGLYHGMGHYTDKLINKNGRFITNVLHDCHKCISKYYLRSLRNHNYRGEFKHGHPNGGGTGYIQHYKNHANTHLIFYGNFINGKLEDELKIYYMEKPCKLGHRWDFEKYIAKQYNSTFTPDDEPIFDGYIKDNLIVTTLPFTDYHYHKITHTNNTIVSDSPIIYNGLNYKVETLASTLKRIIKYTLAPKFKIISSTDFCNKYKYDDNVYDRKKLCGFLGLGYI